MRGAPDERTRVFGILGQQSDVVRASASAIEVVSEEAKRDTYELEAAFSAAEPRNVYNNAVAPCVASVFAGRNAAVVAYGDVASRRQHLLCAPDPSSKGVSDATDAALAPDDLAGGGLAEQVIDSVLTHANASRARGLRCTLRCSFLEVAGDRVIDLLAARPALSNVIIRDHDDDKVPQVLGCEEVKVEEAADALQALRKGFETCRLHAAQQGGVKAYLTSAHTVLTLQVAQQGTVTPDGAASPASRSGSQPGGNGESARANGAHSQDGAQAEWLYQSQLQLVELACCETLKPHGTPSQSRPDSSSKHLETGLAIVNRVVDALLERRSRVPFRDHPLTRLLRPALGGNCETVMLAFVSASDATVARSTLAFAAKMRGIVTHPKQNALLVDKQSEVVCWMRRENRGLRHDLASAHSELRRLTTFIGHKDVHAMKTWDLVAELERAKQEAAELRQWREAEAQRADAAEAAAEAAAMQAASTKSRLGLAQAEAAHLRRELEAMVARSDVARLANEMVAAMTAGAKRSVASVEAQTVAPTPGVSVASQTQDSDEASAPPETAAAIEPRPNASSAVPDDPLQRPPSAIDDADSQTCPDTPARAQTGAPSPDSPTSSVEHAAGAPGSESPPAVQKAGSTAQPGGPRAAAAAVDHDAAGRAPRSSAIAELLAAMRLDMEAAQRAAAAAHQRRGLDELRDAAMRARKALEGGALDFRVQTLLDDLATGLLAAPHSPSTPVRTSSAAAGSVPSGAAAGPSAAHSPTSRALGHDVAAAQLADGADPPPPCVWPSDVAASPADWLDAVLKAARRPMQLRTMLIAATAEQKLQSSSAAGVADTPAAWAQHEPNARASTGAETSSTAWDDGAAPELRESAAGRLERGLRLLLGEAERGLARLGTHGPPRGSSHGGELLDEGVADLQARLSRADARHNVLFPRDSCPDPAVSTALWGWIFDALGPCTPRQSTPTREPHDAVTHQEGATSTPRRTPAAGRTPIAARSPPHTPRAAEDAAALCHALLCRHVALQARLEARDEDFRGLTAELALHAQLLSGLRAALEQYVRTAASLRVEIGGMEVALEHKTLLATQRDEAVRQMVEAKLAHADSLSTVHSLTEEIEALRDRLAGGGALGTDGGDHTPRHRPTQGQSATQTPQLARELAAAGAQPGSASITTRALTSMSSMAGFLKTAVEKGLGKQASLQERVQQASWLASPARRRAARAASSSDVPTTFGPEFDGAEDGTELHCARIGDLVVHDYVGDSSDGRPSSNGGFPSPPALQRRGSTGGAG